MFNFLWSFYVGQRIFEVWLGKKSLNALKDQLITPIDEKEKKQMFWLHGSFFIFFLFEGINSQMASGTILWAGIILLILLQIVRIHSMVVLSPYWVPYPVTFNGQKTIHRGLYRYMKHPNYWAVVIEMYLLPGLCGAYYVSFIWGTLNLFFIFRRMSLEEMALSKLGER